MSKKCTFETRTPKKIIEDLTSENEQLKEEIRVLKMCKETHLMAVLKSTCTNCGKEYESRQLEPVPCVRCQILQAENEQLKAQLANKKPEINFEWYPSQKESKCPIIYSQVGDLELVTTEYSSDPKFSQEVKLITALKERKLLYCSCEDTIDEAKAAAEQWVTELVEGVLK